MWNCPRCSESVEESFSACWNCGTAEDGTSDPDFRPGAELTDIDAQAAKPIDLSELGGKDSADLPPVKVRFSLRTLLLVSTLVAVVSATVTWHAQPRTVDDFFERAVQRYNNGDSRGAIGDLTRAADLIEDEGNHPYRNKIYGIRAAAHTNLGEYQQAVDDASTALDSTDPPIIPGIVLLRSLSDVPWEWLHLLRANAYIELGDYTKATADLNIVAKHFPNDPDLKRMFAIVKGKNSAGP